jgi:hypothetical protein
VFEFLVGLFMVLVAALPNGRFYLGRLGTTQKLPPIEPAWIGRLIIGGMGLGVMLDGLSKIRHH